MRAPTMHDVATHAGTSTAVVSYVLNDGPRPVAAATRARVLAAVAELGYRRNNLARALRARRTSTIGLVVPDLAKPFFAELTRAVEAAAFARGLHLLVGSAHFTSEREHDQLRALLDARVDAVLLVASDDPRHAVEQLRQAEIPYVLMHRLHPDAPGVAGDDTDAGSKAADHLLAHGHRHIAVLGTDAGDDPVSRRARGALATLAQHHHPVPGHLVVDCRFPLLRDEAYRHTHALLTAHPQVSAVCATTDEHALGAMRAAGEAGRRIGDDLALISIDGTELGAFLAPALTTVAVPFADLAASAVDAVLGRPGTTPGPQLHRLNLTVRRSCGCRP
ncbi:LacI family DNA-binding transcriptional regulator [Plantactinospora sp. ZYX-F-223]|uniref:LacI family DNA-binding transcriptional regulator n=1 Tax=Plantactinospora sp. ZYX-F-223 TaxID=3144103 RepID=UPI0031FE1B4E